MKTQNTEIQKHNNIVSVTTERPASSKIAPPPPTETDSTDRDAEQRRAFVRDSQEQAQPN